MSDVVVIGAGPAATAAALAAKAFDASHRVFLVTDESCEPYEKPPLSKNVLLRKSKPGDAPIAGAVGVRGHGVTVVHGTCISIERSSRNIILQDGQRLTYDKLVLATGASCRPVDALPRSLPNVHYLRTAADAVCLREQMIAGRRLLVVGGGLIGLEVAASAISKGMHVDVIEADRNLLARSCPSIIGEYLLHYHRKRGVTCHLEMPATDARISDQGEVVVETAEREFVADVVVVGVGALPNLTLAVEAGLNVEKGICVDQCCRTSDDNIFAAGDVAQIPSPHGAVRLENWAHAQAHGRVAGINAAGGTQTYEATPSFWTEQYELYVQGVGWFLPQTEHVVRQYGENNWLLFGIQDRRVIYAFGVNAQRDMAIGRRLTERKVIVSVEALKDVAVPLQGILKAQPANVPRSFQ